MRRDGKGCFSPAATICWACANAVPDGKRGCPWSKDLEPVPGWVAKKKTGREFDTWKVIECPLFVADDDQTRAEQAEQLRADLASMKEEMKHRAGHQHGRHWVDDHWNEDPAHGQSGSNGSALDYWLQDGR